MQAAPTSRQQGQLSQKKHTALSPTDGVSMDLSISGGCALEPDRANGPSHCHQRQASLASADGHELALPDSPCYSVLA